MCDVELIWLAEKDEDRPLVRVWFWVKGEELPRQIKICRN